MIDKISGRVTYAVMSFGGFLGLGHAHYPLPWAALKYNVQLNGYETGITEKQLKDAPAFSDDSFTNRNWEAQTHTYYNVRPVLVRRARHKKEGPAKRAPLLFR